MNQFKIKSKIFLPSSTRNTALFIIVNSAVIVSVVLTIINIVNRGFSIGNISACISAIVVGALTNKNNPNKKQYKECVISINFEISRIIISYLPAYNRTLEINIESIRSIEYSDKLQCLRMISDYNESRNINSTQKYNSEILVYAKYDENVGFYNMLTHVTNKQIVFVDRV